ncbi:MAG: DNA-protecting protein DprA [Planctomycetota bacterium]|nr:MAG: DNA-protecting protein DprA [Planctomycetota bacterium]REJ87531.1 MAG: DNA-protecting protein DprA [Planctomycetota bacterium]REK31092.1 MAG: DNA-protecting protein DprA [Planctomycetota bacterium]REK44338.1 MAG: DNA-protecting protein DprA [Planctomycetota bacterium]
MHDLPTTGVEAGQPSTDCDAARADWLRLSLVAGIGPRHLRQLLDHFETAAAVLDASRTELQRVPGIGPKLSRAIAEARESIDATAELELCRTNHIDLVTLTDASYPRMLRELADPPPMLFVRGHLSSADLLAVAIVGSRHCTPYGRAQARRLAAGLARAGLTVVSGLARGIDAEAHRGALEGGGRTLAILGGGLLKLFPPEHAELAAEVAQHGAVVSEFPPRMEPQPGYFPQRNRVISGLSLGTIVVEASERSGALITARHAYEQNREVFAVPGPVDSRASRGPHALIRDGARLVATVDDVLEELGPLVEAVPTGDGLEVHRPAELQLNDTERAVLAAVGTQATAIDTVAAESGLPLPRVLATLSVLESRRVVRRLSGQAVVRV